MFNEGYTAHAGDRLIRRDLCLEALRLGQSIACSTLSEPRTHCVDLPS